MVVCAVCGSKKWTKRYKINMWDIEECDSCCFAHIDPLPPKGERAEYYSRENVIKRNARQKSLLRRLSRSMKEFISRAAGRGKSEIFYNKFCKCLPNNSKILDIGCGDGSFLKMAKKNFACTGIEISEYLASLATKQRDIKIIAGDFLDADFKNEKYDGITMISLLEHMNDPLHVLEKCFRLLNNDGILLMKTVNYGCLNRYLRKSFWTGFRPPDHIIYFNPSNLKMLLQKAGFKKIRIRSWPFNDNMYCDTWKS